MGTYFMMQGEKRLGPLSPVEMVQAGMTQGTMVWQQGMDGYAPASSIQELREVEGGLPPDLPGTTNPGASAAPPAAAAASAPAKRYSPEKLRLPNLTWLGGGLLLINAYYLYQELNETWEWRHRGPPGMLVFAEFVVSVGFGVNVLLLLYRAWSLLQSHGARTTPGKAAWLCLVPIFNFYWFFVAIGGLAKDQGAYVRQHSVQTPVVTPGRANLACVAIILVALIGWIPALGTMVAILALSFYLTVLHGLRATSIAIATHQQDVM